MIGGEAGAITIRADNPSFVAEIPHWFAIQTRSRHEKKANVELQEKGIESFLPLHAEKHKWSDRDRIVEVPLFPQYLFVRIAANSEERISVLRTNGRDRFGGAPRAWGLRFRIRRSSEFSGSSLKKSPAIRICF